MPRHPARSRRSALRPSPAARQGAPQVRIIAGQWRGRKLPFAPLPGLRPTPDRIRETLFNWLAAEVPGSHCLDLFAGSGALGLEALSRGAERVTFVDQAPPVADQLAANLQRLACDRAEVITAPAQQWIAREHDRPGFDLVFLDPPFRQGLLAPCCQALEHHGWLAPGAMVYLELESEQTPQTLALPPNWSLWRQKQAGQVRCCLFRRAKRGDRLI